MVKEGLGTTAQACRALGLSRSSYYRPRGGGVERREKECQIVAMSEKHPRFGYRRVTLMLQRKGKTINMKRVQRVRRAEGLQILERPRKMRCCGLSTGQRQRAGHVNAVWSWDFVTDQTENGTTFRILTLIDEYSRRLLAVHVAWSIRAVDVIAVVTAAMARYGKPGHIRSDNGPEFIANAVQEWLAEEQIKTLYITPGSPWENGHIESFHDKLRDECLDRELFGSLLEARVILKQYRNEYCTRSAFHVIAFEEQVSYDHTMTATVEAVYENGVFRPLTALPLEEHAAVRLVVHSSEDVPKPTDSEKSEWRRQSELMLLKVWDNDENDVYNALLKK
jgi:transposase InsO family protein/predicted DNA-binding antitoxin AbrB/MazE fold protein